MRAVAHHRNSHIVGNGGAADLRVGQELRLVNHHAGKLAARMLGGDMAVMSLAASKTVAADSSPMRDPMRPQLVVKLGCQQHGAHAALAVIVRCLKKDGVLAGIHRGEGKIKLATANPRETAPP